MIAALWIATIIITVIVPLAAAALANGPAGDHRRPLSRRIEQGFIRGALATLARVERVTR